MAERITLEGTKAHVTGGDGADIQTDVGSFARTLFNGFVHGMDEEALADDVKWRVTNNKATVCIVELKPQLRRLLWIADDSPVPYGPTAVYKERRLATPYIVLKVVFLNGKIVPRAELFYRNEPLRNLDDPLYWPNLLNVSPNAHGCTAWVCTQYLGSEKQAPGVTGGLDALVHHLFGGGFNRSSEAHEGSSGFSKAKADKIDPRVTDVNTWEKESEKDPRFVLGVAWKPVGLTVRQLLETEFQRLGGVRKFDKVSEIVNVLVSANGKKGG